jgi:osmotically-inducible protein OsmY
MKSALIFLLLGGILGAIALHLYTQREAGQPATISQNTEKNSPTDPALDDKAGAPVADKAKDTATDVKDEINEKLVEWHLTPDDIKNDLAKTGQIVRTNAQAVGGKIADARIVTVIKAKYVIDRDLSAIDISVDSQDGAVSLGGTVASPELIGKAIVLALDTDGVRGVTSKITVATK